jgi:Uncharacterized conserved protein (DUF2190)
MASYSWILGRGYDAAGAIPARRAVVMSDIQEVDLPSAASDVAVGVTQFGVTVAEIAQGKGASVTHMGIVEMEAAEAIAVGVLVGFDTAGKAVAAGTGERVIGMCVGNPSTNDTDYIDVLLAIPGPLSP